MSLPGSKSIMLRDLLLAALAEGTSELLAPADCDDVWRMEGALRSLGVEVERHGRERVVVHGVGGRFPAGDATLDVGMSATSARLLIAAMALRTDATLIDGHESMRARPNGVLVDALRHLGSSVEAERDGYLPMTLRGPSSMGGSVSMDGSVSSQYFSGLMVMARCTPGGLTIDVEGPLVSRPYVDITLQEMRRFGGEVTHEDYQRFVVPPGGYRAVTTTVEGDASAASYFEGLAVLHGGTLVMENVGSDTPQGDYQFLTVCERLGATVTREPGRTTVTRAPGTLPELPEIDMERMPDVAPTLMCMAPFIPGPTRITGLATLRIKECDRIAVPARELTKLGVRVEEGDDFIVVHALEDGHPIREASIDTYDDHRIGMSFGMLGTRLPGVSINDPECVGKTYPGFWDDLESLYGDA